MERDGISEKEAEKYIKEVDEKRTSFHKYCTDTVWGDAKEYQLCLDTGKIGFEKTAELIMNYINAKKHCNRLVTKDFRTFLLKNSLSYLNKILKDYSSQLFSNESDLIYISENDNKLDIMLGNATYESLSGGEKTRVNIALLLAQKSLANMIGNISCNIIILDEILGYCDALAENNVINLITKELESLETIYMISHKEIPIGYDTELIVEKNANGLTHLKSY